MRHLSTILSSILLTATGVALGLAQDPADQDGEGGRKEQDEPPARSPFTRFFEEERERIREGIEGAWRLFELDTFEGIVDPEDVRGFAQFHNGYAYLLLMVAAERDVVFGSGVGYTVLTGAYRYQVSEDVTLQFASVLGFDNLYTDSFFEFHQAGDGMEFEIELVEAEPPSKGFARDSLTTDELVLREREGLRLTLRRMPEKAGFPEKTADRLRLRRTGWEFSDDEEDWR